VAAEWHPARNKDRTPNDVIVGACDFAWWKCSKKACRHVWKARIFSRTKGFAGCQRCADREHAELTRQGKLLGKQRRRAKAQTLRVINSPPNEDF
jgi:hypothetical protein